MNKKKEFVIMVGLPRSGKTTHIRNNYQHHVEINRDTIRLLLHNTPYDASREEEVGRIEMSKVDQAIIQKENIVIDATHCTTKRRQKWIDLYNSRMKHDYTLIVCYIGTSKDVCLERVAGSYDYLPNKEDRLKYEEGLRNAIERMYDETDDAMLKQLIGKEE